MTALALGRALTPMRVRRGFGDDDLSRERRAWDAVLFGGPRSKIRELTALGTEWTPGVYFPRRGLMAQRANHEISVLPDSSEVQPWNVA